MREKDISNYNRIDQSYEDIIKDFSKHKKAYICSFAVICMLAMVVVSWVMQYIGVLFNKQDSIYIMSLFTRWTESIISIIVTICLIFVLSKTCYRYYKLTDKDFIQDYEENYKRSKYGVYGDAHWQTEEERDKCFVRSKNVSDIKGDILGIDSKNRIYALRDDLIGINKNKIAFGAAGSGKSAAIVLNDIMQIINRGESAIITDSKGDVYRDTSHIARKHGYVVRVLNLKAKELKNSDSWEPLKYVTEEDEIQAEVLANAIIENTMDGPMEYWSNNEMNCLKATILLVATTPMYEGHRSMREVVDIISSPASFDAKFAGLSDDNPAKNAYNIYAACKDDVKKQILNGMGIRLSLLTNKYIKEIISHDEIDLVLPMKRKCIYYIIISDTDTTMKFLASMFFTQIFMVQCDYSDSLTKSEKKKQLPVRYELDEFKNIGKIPYFDTKISTFRSRKISSTLILQGITQLQELYPHKAHQVILANTTTQILLKAGDTETAKHFSELCGVLTVKVENAKHDTRRTKILDLHNSQGISEGLGKRELLMPDKAMKLDSNLLIVCIAGQQPVKINKFICEKLHPMYKETKECPPNKHLPAWRKEKIAREKADAERIAELKANSSTNLSTNASTDADTTHTSSDEHTSNNTNTASSENVSETTKKAKRHSKEKESSQASAKHTKPDNKSSNESTSSRLGKDIEQASRTKGSAILDNLLQED